MLRPAHLVLSDARARSEARLRLLSWMRVYNGPPSQQRRSAKMPSQQPKSIAHVSHFESQHGAGYGLKACKDYDKKW